MNSKRYLTKPTLDDLLGDPLIDAELQRAWAESNPHAPAVPYGKNGSTKREQGGWIVWNPKTGLLQAIRVPSIARDELEMNLTGRPIENTEQVVVAWFHTHPNTREEGYAAKPTVEDVLFTRLEARVPCILETHSGRMTISC